MGKDLGISSLYGLVRKLEISLPEPKTVLAPGCTKVEPIFMLITKYSTIYNQRIIKFLLGLCRVTTIIPSMYLSQLLFVQNLRVIGLSKPANWSEHDFCRHHALKWGREPPHLVNDQALTVMSSHKRMLSASVNRTLNMFTICGFVKSKQQQEGRFRLTATPHSGVFGLPRTTLFWLIKEGMH